MKLDHIVLERICYNNYNEGVLNKIPVNLRNYELQTDINFDGSISRQYISCDYKTGDSKHLTTTVISMEEYLIYIRDKKIEELGL
jgi:hypothetical protein